MGRILWVNPVGSDAFDEASMLFACSLGHQFSILVGRRKWIPKMRDNAITVGIDRRIASFRSLEMSIPQMFEDPADLGVAGWKWAEMVADIYRRTGLSHGRAFGYEAPPV